MTIASYRKRLACLLSLVQAFVMILSSCGGGNASKGKGMEADHTVYEDSSKVVVPGYAEGFDVKYVRGGCLVDIHDPQKPEGEGEIYRFALVRDKEQFDFKSLPSGYTTLDIPLQSVICMTSLQLSSFIRMGEVEHIVGITSTRHLFNKEIQDRISKGLISKIGIEGNFDNEVIINMNPDVIFISPFKRGGYEALTEVGIPLMPHLGYKEKHPLAQAEWIKFTGLLIGEEEKANRIFDSISSEYEKYARLAGEVKHRPVVFSGEQRGGNWYAVGGQNFLAQLFRDAGADYFLKDDPNTGGITLDFETVYSRAEDCDYWRILNSYNGQFSYDALKDQDPRYADFKAFKEKNILYCNLREKAYYENIPTHPEILLKDFIKAFHPELLPDYKPVFYEILK